MGSGQLEIDATSGTASARFVSWALEKSGEPLPLSYPDYVPLSWRLKGMAGQEKPRTDACQAMDARRGSLLGSLKVKLLVSLIKNE
jgi:hypothetical protein